MIAYKVLGTKLEEIEYVKETEFYLITPTGGRYRKDKYFLSKQEAIAHINKQHEIEKDRVLARLNIAIDNSLNKVDQPIKKYRDFCEKAFLEGIKVSTSAVIGKEIVILDYTIKEAHSINEHQYLVLQFYYLDDDTKTKYILITDSPIMIAVVERYAYNIPFATTLKEEYGFIVCT